MADSVKKLALVSAFAIFATGCVCLPFASPPMEISAGVAPTADQDKVGVAGPIDVSAKPLGAFTRFWDREFDAGIGYRFVPNSIGRTIHGPTVQASYLVPVSLKTPVRGKSDLGMRFGFTGLGNLALGGGLDGYGYGATFRFTTEWIGFDNGPYDSCTYTEEDPGFQDLDGDGYDDSEDTYSCSFGNSFGEGGIGLFAEASYVDFGPRSVGWIGFGLILRIPAAAGIFIGSIFD